MLPTKAEKLTLEEVQAMIEKAKPKRKAKAKAKTKAKPKAKKTSVKEDLISLIDKAQKQQDKKPKKRSGDGLTG